MPHLQHQSANNLAKTNYLQLILEFVNNFINKTWLCAKKKQKFVKEISLVALARLKTRNLIEVAYKIAHFFITSTLHML